MTKLQHDFSYSLIISQYVNERFINAESKIMNAELKTIIISKNS